MRILVTDYGDHIPAAAFTPVVSTWHDARRLGESLLGRNRDDWQVNETIGQRWTAYNPQTNRTITIVRD